MHPADLGHGVTPPEDGHRPEVAVAEGGSCSPLRQGQHRARRVAPGLDGHLGQHGQGSLLSGDLGDVTHYEDLGVPIDLERGPDDDPPAGTGGREAGRQRVSPHPGCPNRRGCLDASTVFEGQSVRVRVNDRDTGLDPYPLGPKRPSRFVLQIRGEGGQQGLRSFDHDDARLKVQDRRVVASHHLGDENR